MRHLFSAEGQQALAAVLTRNPLLAFDFDGTLAPIVARPEEARVSTAVARMSRELAELRPVAVITGRAVDDVSQRLGFRPHYIIGNHGAEDPLGRLSGGTLAHLDRCRQRLAQEAGRLAGLGISVEDKRYSLALHYRLAENRAAALAAIKGLLPELGDNLKVFHGKCVLNIAPADAADKGNAVAMLIERSGAGSAVFLGDDINDEAVFAYAPDHWLTVRVGKDTASQAQFFLESHAEVAVLLEQMLRLLKQGPRLADPVP